MLLLLSVATWLAATHPPLEKGRALYESQRYERAAEELRQATQMREMGSPEQPLVFLAVPSPGLPSSAGVGPLLAVLSSQDSSAADRAPWTSEPRELDSRARRKALQSHFLFGGALVGGAGAVVLLTTF